MVHLSPGLNCSFAASGKAFLAPKIGSRSAAVKRK
jgi:hypothetical protein